jgi:hypothetical protein
MRVNGLNVFAIAAAAVAIYAIGFVIYGLVFQEQWMAWAGYDQASFAGQEWRMAISPVMPILIAIGVALVMKWRNASGLAAGAATGFWLGLFFLVGSRLYGFAYGVEPAELLALDSAHLLLNGLVAGAVIGAMK